MCVLFFSVASSHAYPSAYSNWTKPQVASSALPMPSSYMSLDAAVEWSGSPEPHNNDEKPTIMDATTALNEKFQTVVEAGDINGIVQISQDFISTALLIGRLIIDEVRGRTRAVFLFDVVVDCYCTVSCTCRLDSAHWSPSRVTGERTSVTVVMTMMAADVKKGDWAGASFCIEASCSVS